MPSIDEEFNNISLSKILKNIIQGRIGTSGIITALSKMLDKRADEVRELNVKFDRQLEKKLFQEYNRVCSPDKIIVFLLDAQKEDKLREAKESLEHALWEGLTLKIEELYKIVLNADEMPISISVILEGTPKPEPDSNQVIPKPGLNLDAMSKFK